MQNSVATNTRNLIARFLVWISVQTICIYQRIAPKRIRDSCRFEPTCSNYAIGVINAHGFRKGWKLTIMRLLKCRPPNGGKDDIPHP